ncbi:MAG: hypothetical protein AB3N16_01245 [Flavobacteriaceae bacterium]
MFFLNIPKKYALGLKNQQPTTTIGKKNQRSKFNVLNKNTTLMRMINLLPLILFFWLPNTNAQAKLRIEPGFLLNTDSENLGLMFNVEPKIKSSKNAIIGLRFGIALNPQKFKIDDSSSFFIDGTHDNGVISFVPTYDYFLNDNFYRPYLGFGMGYYIFNNIDVSERNGSSGTLEGSVNNQLGFLIRGGLELGFTRIGLEYNVIPKADIQILDGRMAGTVDNSYLGLSIGFGIGGRKRP